MNKTMNKILRNTLLLGFAPLIMLTSSQSMAVDIYQYSAGTGPDSSTTSSYIVDNSDPYNNYYYLNDSTGLYENVYGNSFNGATDVLSTFDGTQVFDVYSAEASHPLYLDYQAWSEDIVVDTAAFNEQSLNATDTGSTTTTGGAGSVGYNADDITGTIENIQNTAIAVMGAFITLGLTVMFYRKIRGLASRG